MLSRSRMLPAWSSAAEPPLLLLPSRASAASLEATTSAPLVGSLRAAACALQVATHASSRGSHPSEAM